MYKFAAFTYDFPHWKTQNGLLNLVANGFKPDAVIAAPWQQLTLVASARRVFPVSEYLLKPIDIARMLDIPYFVVEHNSNECVEYIQENEFGVGVVLGARILKKDIIDSFKRGILNIHPGKLPANRGLDNLKWAVIKDIPMTVTAHWIDERVDRGIYIAEMPVPILNDDTFIDIAIRSRGIEQRLLRTLMPTALMPFVPMGIGPIGKGKNRGVVPPEIDAQLDYYLERYKEKHAIQ